MDFDLVPDELKHVATGVGDFLHARGYAINDLDDDLSYPLSPSFTAKRHSAVTILEVASTVDEARVEKWIIYAKGCGSDTRVAICIDDPCSEKDSIVSFAAHHSLGVYALDGGDVRELLEPRDLSAPTVVPNLATEGADVRTALGPAIEEYERGKWQDGLRSANRGFEEVCRRRLIQLHAQGVHFAPVNNRKKPPTPSEINKAALGQIRTFFSMVDPSTAETSAIVRVIDEIRDPRNDIAHKNDSPEHKTQAVRLLYVILRGVRELNV